MKRDFNDKLKKLIPYIPFFIFFVYSCVIHSSIGMRDWDDYVYKEAWTNISVWDWCQQFYRGWSGRIPLQALDIIFLQLPVWVWRIWDTILYTLCPYFLSEVVLSFGRKEDKKQLLVTNTLICLAFIIIPRVVLGRVVFWISGSFNYLLPCVGLFMALYPFAELLHDRNVKRGRFILAFIGAFLCCYAEQTAAIFVCLAGFIILFSVIRKIKISKVHYILLLWGLLQMIIEYVAPGNYVRYDSEVLLWYNQYDMYSIVDKLLLGVSFCVKMLVSYGWMFFGIILLLMAFRLPAKPLIYKIGYGGLIVFSGGMWYLMSRISENTIFWVDDIKSVMILFFMISWIIILTIFMHCLYDENEIISILLPLVLLAAFAAGAVVAMSPSCFEAEQRVFFVSYMMLIFAIGLQIQTLPMWKDERGKNEKVH